MCIPSQNAATYQVYLLTLLRYIVGCIRVLPAALAQILVVAVRVLFFALLGFAAWVRDFTDVQFGSFILVILAMWHIFQYFHKKPFADNMQADEVKEERTHEMLSDQVSTYKSICNVLERVRSTLESKSLIETLAEKNEKFYRQNVLDLQRKSDRLQEEVQTLSNERAILTQQLEMKNSENERIRDDFAKQLEQLQRVVYEVREMEENKSQVEKMFENEQEATQNLEKENSMLRATVQIMTKQRKQLVEKHAEVTNRVATLNEENESLSSQLMTASQDKCNTHDRDKIKRLTERIQSSLSLAKGKLSRVGGVLNSDVPPRECGLMSRRHTA